MKDIHKNPLLYYIAAPVLLILWPLLVSLFYIPAAKEQYRKNEKYFNDAVPVIKKILDIDPERLDFAADKDAAAEFDYAANVEKIAQFCRIRSDDYKLSSGPITKSKSGKTQKATVSLKEVDITRFAKFLSTIQLRWASLQLERMKLTQRKGLKDKWDIDLDFKYYF